MKRENPKSKLSARNGTRAGRKNWWKRKTATLLTAVLLTGTISDGLTMAGMGTYVSAYAYASSSNAGRDTASALPDKGKRADYYIEEGNAAELILSEAVILDALESEEEMTLDLRLLGYEDARSVLPVYEEIREQSEGYRLVFQDAFADDNELSCLVFVKEKKGRDVNLLEDMKVMVINHGHAADETQAYNVLIQFEGNVYRLESEAVQLFTLKDLTREQLEEAGRQEEEDYPDTDTGQVIIIDGDQAGMSQGQGSGGSPITGETDAAEEDVNVLPTEDGHDGETSEEAAGGEETAETESAEETTSAEETEPAEEPESVEEPKPEKETESAGETKPDGNTDGDEDKDISGEGQEAGKDERPDDSQGENDAEEAGEEENGEASDDTSFKEDSEEKAEDADGSKDESEQEAADPGEETQENSEAEAEDSGKDSEEDQAEGTITASIRKLQRVFASLASSSQAALEEQIEKLRQELKDKGEESYEFSRSGSFKMSSVEMKMINQEEITEEDLQEAQDTERSVFSRLMSRVNLALNGDEEQDDAGDYGSSLVGPDTADLPYIGIRANTLAVMRFSGAPLIPDQDEVEIDWSTLPISDDDRLYYGVEYSLDGFLPESRTVKGSDGKTYDVSITNILRCSGGTIDSGWLWNGTSSITVDEDNIDEYRITFTAEDEVGNVMGTTTITLSVCVVAFQLPAFQYFMRDNTYDLYDTDGGGVKAADQEGKTYDVRLRSVERRLVNGQADTWDWEEEGKPSQITIDQSNIVEYLITYEAYMADPDNPEEEIIVGISDPLRVEVYQSSGIGDTVDQAGDVAYVTAAYIANSLRTGTAPWDDAVLGQEEPGEDVTDLDDRLRTFDTASFNVQVQSRVRAGSPYTHYRNGTLCYEFILPGSAKQVMFDEGGMSWLQAKPNSSYQISTMEMNGEEVQVLRGSFLWEPSDGNPTAIGESYLELNVAYRVLNMKNGDTIAPRATFWLGVNQVSEDPDAGLQFSDDGAAESYRFPNELVTDNGVTCEKHGETEPSTIYADPVTITAAPRYNLRLVFDGTTQTSVGSFDFSTGNDLAPNKGNYVVENGRIGVLGVTVQIHGKTGLGLRGVEFPDEDKPITFDLTLSSTFTASGELSETYDITKTDYTPLVWSVDGNSSSRTQQDGRVIPANITGGSKNSANNSGGNNYSCYQGGSWRAEQDENIVHVTVSGFEISQNLAQIPNSGMGTGNPNATTYFDRSVIKNYWDLTTLSFSAGEIWIVQPFTRTLSDGNTMLILEDEDILGAGNSCSAGNFTVSVRDGNLFAESVSGQVCAVPESSAAPSVDTSNQMVISDDNVSQSYQYRLPGTFDNVVYYNKYAGAYYEPLTENCRSNGQDWAVIGGKMDLQIQLSHDSKDQEFGGVAYDTMIKFDDAMFQPQLETVNGVAPTSGGYRALYGVLKDHETTGWPNKELDPADPTYDDVIKNATAEDMIFYSLADFKKLQEEKGYVCVAVLGEWRGDYSAQMTHNHFYVRGSVKLDDDLAGNVYMITFCSYGWTRNDLEEEARNYLNKPDGELSSTDWIEYSRDGFPSMEGRTDGYAGYPTFSLREDCMSGGDAQNIKKYVKAQYYEDGSLAYDNTDPHWADSCYIVGYEAQIRKDTAQTTVTNGQKVTKRYYDLDGGQRTADYVLYPTIVRAGGVDGAEGTDQKFIIDEIVIRDELPDKLYYIDGFGYMGGEYQQRAEGIQGTVEGGTDIFERMSMKEEDKKPILVSDGTQEIMIDDVSVKTETDSTGRVTAIVWTLAGVEVYANRNTTLPALYYSCTIGRAGMEDDVENNQQLENVVTIGGTNLSTKYAMSDGNMAELSVFVNKLQATSLSKIADSAAVEVGDPMGFQLRVGNNSENAMNIVAFDKMPYVGDEQGTSIGEENRILLTEISFNTDDPEVIRSILGNDPDNLQIRFFYTTDEKYRKMDSSDFMDPYNKTVSTEEMDKIRESKDWIELEVAYDPEDPLNAEIRLPGGEFSPVAIAMVGVLDGGVTIPLHTTLKLTNPQPGDYIGTTLSNKDMQSTARSFVVNRTIEGLAWKDSNNNGLRESGEELFDGLSVTLKRTGPAKEGGDNSESSFPEEGIKIFTGEQYDYLTGETTLISEGNYRFTNVPEGTYTVIFASGTESEQTLTYYAATEVNKGSNDEVDSDASGVYDAKDANVLLWSEITGIVMNQLSDIQTMNFASRHNDAGFVIPKGNLKLEKRDSTSGELLSGAKFRLTGTGEMPNGNIDSLFVSSAQEFIDFITAYAAQAGIEVTGYSVSKIGHLTLEFTVIDGRANFGLTGFDYMRLPRGKYTLTEIQTPDGYTFPDGEQVSETFYIDNSSLVKDLTGNNALLNIPQTFTLQKVSAASDQPIQGVVFTVTASDGSEIHVITGEDGKAELALPYLAVGTEYTVTESRVPSGYVGIDPFTFTVANAEYTSAGEHKVKLSLASGTSSAVSADEDGLVITVKNQVETVTIEGTKSWNDHNNQDGKRPAAVTVTLQRRVGQEEWQNVTVKNTSGENVPLTATITGTNPGYKFEGLPKYDETRTPLAEYEYRVSEDPNKLNGYTPSGGEKQEDGKYDLVNSWTPETTSFAGEKTWVDGGNKDQTRPGSIQIQLYGTYEIQDEIYYLVMNDDGEYNSKEVQDQDQKPVLTTKEVSEADDGTWTWSFTDLPKYWNGQKVNYYIEEAPVNGYETTVSRDGNVTNTYYASAAIQLKGTKTFTGRDLADGESFTFGVYDENNTKVTTGKTQSAGSGDMQIIFDPIAYNQDDMKVKAADGRDIVLSEKTFTYTVREDIPDDAQQNVKDGIQYDGKAVKVQVKVTADSETGTLSAEQITPAEDIAFTNTYEATASNAIYGRKLIDYFGEIKDPDEESFTFALYDETGTEIDRAVSDSEGNFQFKAQSYSLSQMKAEGKTPDGDGVYRFTYTVREISNVDWFIKDENVFTVTVEITDNLDGTLKVESAYADQKEEVKGGIVFTNTYIASGSEAVRMTKELTGRVLEGGQFAFGLYVNDTEGEGGLKEIARSVNDEDGNILFDAEAYQIRNNVFSFDRPGEYTYYVREIILQSMPGYTCDSSLYRLVFNVKDGGKGMLDVEKSITRYPEGTVSEDGTPADAVVFENRYDLEKLPVDLAVEKRLTGRVLEEGQFIFQVYEGEKLVAEAVNDAEGKVPLKLTFTAPGTYHYTVFEADGQNPGYVYDGRTFDVTAEVADNGDGTMSASIIYQLAGETVENVVFENSYFATGSNALRVTKKLTGRKLEDGQFTFGLYVEGENGLEQIAQAVNDASGDVRFTAEEYKIQDNTFIFNDPGVYTFYVREEIPESMPGYTCDQTLYRLTFTAVDLGTGELDVSLAITAFADGQRGETGTEAEEVVFANRYHMEETGAQLAVEKRLTGRTLEDGQFTFRLYEGDKVLAETVNDAEGWASFSLTFAAPGTYRYTILEVNDQKPGYQYDSQPVNVTAVVEDNGDGTMSVEISYEKEGNTADHAVFENQYTTGTARFAPQVRKVLEGRNFYSSDIFTFGLRKPDGTEETAELIPGRGGQTAVISFSGVEYGQEDVGKTFIYEIYEKEGSAYRMTYSDVVYTISVTVHDAGNGELYLEVTDGTEAFDGIAEFVNTYRPSGGGGGNNSSGGGGNNGGGRVYPDSGTPTTTITSDGVPLAAYPGDAAATLIPEEEVPLFGLPRTGDPSFSLSALAGAMIASLAGILAILRKKKKEEE